MLGHLQCTTGQPVYARGIKGGEKTAMRPEAPECLSQAWRDAGAGEEEGIVHHQCKETSNLKNVTLERRRKSYFMAV